MIHKMIPGTSERTIIGLHGTGGTEEDMFQIARYIDPEATYIGIRGNIVEDGMNRYFRRIDMKTFDLESLEQETTNLRNEILKLLKNYDRSLECVSVVGYSNGANITLNLLKMNFMLFKNALLFHPMHVQPAIPFPQNLPTRVLITSGEGDPYTDVQDIELMIEKLNASNIFTTHFHTHHGHQLIPEEIKQTRDFYEI
ncbi:phospholipase [Erysipelothrix piscisicarius]|uniref:Phospholipase n=1 Tax=Erysipelothrix piscisicarius TaxID=2485784 RepID=A0A3S8RKZ3_9FIRM|nr:dienelactone hydrolase family protein [Erysipelothrix piscisicarius]AZK43598.1 phospholipase [Erysipelothrix piscisicarius]